ncbi:MAG TPA: LCP family protein [Acidimicrobiales bacterium]|nr:LCP family protein [Acidimicrobiales bacterium]
MATPPEEVGQPRVRRERRWPRRLLIAANIVVALCVVTTAAGYGYVRWKFGQIATFDDLGDVLRRGGGDDVPPGEPMNVLVVGSDTREGVEAAGTDNFGGTRAVQGQRSDTIILLRVDPKNERAAMLSIPRDLFVPIAGTGRSNRINTAFEAGEDRLIQTVAEALGVPIDHYVQVDFNGFRGIVGAVGGVQIYSDARARDTVTGLDIPNPGCITLDGDQALAYVRSRQYQYFENGKWRTDPTGDLGRIQRQQDFVRRVLKKANEKARGLNFPAISRLVDTGVKNVQIDKGFGPGEIAQLANRFKSLDPDAVQMLTIPTVPANVGGASVLRMKQPEAQQVIDTFLAKAPAAAAPADVPAIPPGNIRMRVLNGSGAEGQAREVGGDLSGLGFNVAGLGQADSFRYTDSVITYATGQLDKAKVVQSRIQGPSQLEEDPTLRSIDVVLITGGSFGGVAGAASATTAPPPTTAPGKAPATTAPPADPGPQC